MANSLSSKSADRAAQTTLILAANSYGLYASRSRIKTIGASFRRKDISQLSLFDRRPHTVFSHICQADRRDHESFSSSGRSVYSLPLLAKLKLKRTETRKILLRSEAKRCAGWSNLFQSLADLGTSLEAASSEFTHAKEASRNSQSVEAEIEIEAANKADFSSVPVDIEEDKEGYSLWIDVPGLQKTDVKVEIFPVRRVITVSWERSRALPKVNESSSGHSFRRRYERRVGRFSRTLRLAKDLDPTTVVAKVERGVLHIYGRKHLAATTEPESVQIDIE